jgi:hypothetical protein
MLRSSCRGCSADGVLMKAELRHARRATPPKFYCLRKKGLHAGAGAELHRPYISWEIGMPADRQQSASTGTQQQWRFNSAATISSAHLLRSWIIGDRCGQSLTASRSNQFGLDHCALIECQPWLVTIRQEIVDRQVWHLGLNRRRRPEGRQIENRARTTCHRERRNGQPSKTNAFVSIRTSPVSFVLDS